MKLTYRNNLILPEFLLFLKISQLLKVILLSLTIGLRDKNYNTSLAILGQVCYDNTIKPYGAFGWKQELQ